MYEKKTKSNRGIKRQKYIIARKIGEKIVLIFVFFG